MSTVRIATTLSLLLCLAILPSTISASSEPFREGSNVAHDGETAAKSLRTMERLLDTAKYREAKAEWETISHNLRHAEIKPILIEQIATLYWRLIKKALDESNHREAKAEWEKATGSHPSVREYLSNHFGLIWEIPRVYVRLGESEKAIQLYKHHHYVAPESAEERARVGERLILGQTLEPGTKERFFVGRGQCTLCHEVSKGGWVQECNHSRCGPSMRGLVDRIKILLASPTHIQRRKDSVQSEAFPGSGIATNVIEYLAESNVCPNCYVVPGYLNYPDENGRESRMPKIQGPPISLSRDKMIAIDTWILGQDGANVPSLQEMRAAYDKFLPREDDPGTGTGVFLASLYDAAGDLSEAVRLVEDNYPIVWKREPAKSALGYVLDEWRNDAEMFANMKQRPELVARFPLLLKPGSKK